MMLRQSNVVCTGKSNPSKLLSSRDEQNSAMSPEELVLIRIRSSYRPSGFGHSKQRPRDQHRRACWLETERQSTREICIGTAEQGCQASRPRPEAARLVCVNKLVPPPSDSALSVNPLPIFRAVLFPLGRRRSGNLGKPSIFDRITGTALACLEGWFQRHVSVAG